MIRNLRLNGGRGRFLALFGCISMLVGLAVSIPSQPRSSVRFLVELGIPFVVWGGLLGLAGLTGLWTAFVRPPGKDKWGFIVLSAAFAVGVPVYLFSWFAGYPRGWLLAALFAGLAGAVRIVSGMMDADVVLYDSETRMGEDHAA